MTLTPRLRSALTLGTLCLLLVLAALVGWRSATAPLPQIITTELCVDTDLVSGEILFPDQVAVSVFNASSRNGLASKTLNQLEGRGFVPADTGNAPDGTQVRGVQIWGDVDNPAVSLVKQHFRSAEVRTGPQLGVGVVVVVGDGYQSLRPAKAAPPSVDVQAAATVCSPPGS
ncbi:LytR C-terminal domain-containing protein [Nocardioides sp. 616]|uniref:LytR C-terminal domain-containing protein n=1 Tax=Nocardioides sp. 616 TaxID=2268090 RepID=UPI000CE51A71|nr:LytR C-terminal domain-containing protein [Nocardioides sp. 616]